MDTTPTGQNTINTIQNGNNDVTIQRGAVNQTTPNNEADGTAAGKPTSNPAVPGTGNGTGSTIEYNPDREPPTAADPTVRRPADVALNHEASHAGHMTNGAMDGSPDPANPNNPDIEETNTINEDNAYRRDRGIPPRADHTVL
jgi:hypothetical protein